jgi:hypothetical protein
VSAERFGRHVLFGEDAAAHIGAHETLSANRAYIVRLGSRSGVLSEHAGELLLERGGSAIKPSQLLVFAHGTIVGG